MSRITKLELSQALAERNAQLEAARAQISLLQHEVATLKRAAAVTDAAAQYLEAKARVLSAPTSPYRAALARAKEMAMLSGRTTRVGGAA